MLENGKQNDVGYKKVDEKEFQDPPKSFSNNDNKEQQLYTQHPNIKYPFTDEQIEQFQI